MSIRHLNAAFQAPDAINGARRLVLIALADSCNDDGYCWPKRETIAKKAGIKRLETVTDHLGWLESNGWIVRKVNGWAGIDGQIPVGKRPNVYYLPLDENGGMGTRIPGRGGTRIPGSHGYTDSGEENHHVEPPHDPSFSTSEISGEPEPASNEVVSVSDSSSDVTKPTAKHPDAQRLTETLFRCYALHADLEAPPKITQTSIRDMDLLLRRGPVELEAHEIKPEHVERVIHGIFDMLAERRDGFCWADQIRSPGNLRKHWTRIRGELNRNHQTRQTRDTDLDELIAIGFEMNRREAQQ